MIGYLIDKAFDDASANQPTGLQQIGFDEGSGCAS